MDDVIADRTCSKCGETMELNVNNFAKESNGRWRSECRPCGRKMCREYKAKNRQHVADYNKKYKAEKSDDISEYNKKYYAEHMESEKERTRVTHARLYKEDPNFKMAKTMRKRIYAAVKGERKLGTAKELLGCDFDVFMTWIEFQFDDKMSFENQGSYWQIDHVIPCASFDLSDPTQQSRCFHWTNLRPMEATENNRKKDKILPDVIKNHKKVLNHFLEHYGEIYEGQFALLENKV